MFQKPSAAEVSASVTTDSTWPLLKRLFTYQTPSRLLLLPAWKTQTEKTGISSGKKKYKLNKEVKRVIMKAGKLCGAPFTDKHTGPL